MNRRIRNTKIRLKNLVQMQTTNYHNINKPKPCPVNTALPRPFNLTSTNKPFFIPLYSFVSILRKNR